MCKTAFRNCLKTNTWIAITLFSSSILWADTTPNATYSKLGDPHLKVVPRTDAEAARVARVTAPTEDFTAAHPFEKRPAGAATVRVLADTNAFSQPSGNITFEDELAFKLGNGLFRKLWVSSPSSTLASDGLGPVYNARSCQRCHIKDGRGHPPESPQDNAISMFLRVSIMDPGGHAEDAAIAQIEDYIATKPDPTYGTQLQDFAVQGHASEYRLDITYSQEVVTLADGTEVSLRHPTYTAADLGYGPLAPGAMLSPRVAPQMIGLGLLEAIPAADILAHADPDDADGDGISGRPNIVWSVEYDQPMLGRFGLKAGNPTIMQQSAGPLPEISGFQIPCSRREAANVPPGRPNARMPFMAMTRRAAPRLMQKVWTLSHFTAATLVYRPGAVRVIRRCCVEKSCFTRPDARPATHPVLSRTDWKISLNRVFS